MIAQTLSEVFTQMGRLTGGLPFKPLYGERQRKSLGGYLFGQGPPIVTQVGRCMSSRPELFTEYPKSGEQILDLQAEADGWLALRRRLEELTVQVNDSYLSTQAEAIRAAMEVAAIIKHEAALPPALRGVGSVKRLRVLCPALVVFYTYRRSLLKTKAKRKEVRAKMAAAPDLAAAKLEKHKKRSARIKVEKRRSESRAELNDKQKQALLSIQEKHKAGVEAPAGARISASPESAATAADTQAAAGAESGARKTAAKNDAAHPPTDSSKNTPITETSANESDGAVGAAPSRRRSER